MFPDLDIDILANYPSPQLQYIDSITLRDSSSGYYLSRY
jgi:hypothetical protein